MRTMISLIFFFTAIFLQAQVQQEWVRNLYSNGSSAGCINTDICGNAYIVGSATWMDSPIFTCLQKIKSDGTVLWQTMIDTPCAPVGVYMDSLFNQYIAGYDYGYWGPDNFTVMKIDTAGHLVWRHLDSIIPNEYTVGIDGDKTGNSYVLTHHVGTNKITKYNSSGILQHSFNILDTITPRTIILDGENNILVAGTFQTSQSITSAVLIKYNQAGIRMWKSTFTPPDSGTIVSYTRMKLNAHNSAGNIYLMITCNLPSLRNYTIVKYNSIGGKVWDSYYACSNGSSSAHDFVIDRQENIYITGDCATVKLDSLGFQQWADLTTNMRAITIDKYSNVYCAGVDFQGYHNSNKTIKIDHTGLMIWSILHPALQNNMNYTTSVALDTSINVFVIGLINYNPIEHGYGATIKYSQLSSIKKTNKGTPEYYSLSQNYPNPFNPVTKIKFDIPPLSFGEGKRTYGAGVRLIIYDILGREITTLVNDKLSPGTYEVEWDGTNYPSGVYFYKLAANDYSETKKMVLVK